MADADLASLIPDPMPQWLQRAMDPSTPIHPYGEALKRGDFILIPGPPGAETAERATGLSKFISNTLINNARAGQVEKPLYDRAP